MFFNTISLDQPPLDYRAADNRFSLDIVVLLHAIDRHPLARVIEIACFRPEKTVTSKTKTLPTSLMIQKKNVISFWQKQKLRVNVACAATVIIVISTPQPSISVAATICTQAQILSRTYPLSLTRSYLEKRSRTNLFKIPMSANAIHVVTAILDDITEIEWVIPFDI